MATSNRTRLAERAQAVTRGEPNRGRWVTFQVVAFALVPGVLAGAQLAGLLFFLNPHLSFAPGLVARAVGIYGSLLGLLSLAIHLPFTWGRALRARAVLPWTLTLVVALTAVSAWVHASRFSFFLPPGINRRLLKLGILMTLSAVVAFYTALLHRLSRRPYGPKSIGLLALLAVLSIYVAFERRDAFRPAIVPAPRATTVEHENRPYVLAVGLDWATLDAVLPLAELGHLPFFARLQREGASGRLATLLPAVRGPLWTTAATGKYPYKHGVVGSALFAAPFAHRGQPLSLLPAAIRFRQWGTWRLDRPVDARARRDQALWEILPRLGVPTAVVGWPLSAPISEVSQSVLSEQFFAGSSDPTAWAPPELGERARLFRTRRSEIDPDIAGRFGDQPPAFLLDQVAGDLWRKSIAGFLLEQDPPPAATFLMLPGLEAVSRQFYGAHEAVHFAGSSAQGVTSAASILAAYYALIDSFLSELWERLPEPRLMIVMSTHGTEGPYGLRKIWQAILRQPGIQGFSRRGPRGLLMMLGQGVRAGTILDQADLVDLAPTLLYGLGFPIAEDLDGVVLTSAFDGSFLARHPLTFVPSFEALASRPNKTP